jgi:hypothetical protein
MHDLTLFWQPARAAAKEFVGKQGAAFQSLDISSWALALDAVRWEVLLEPTRSRAGV